MLVSFYSLINLPPGNGYSTNQEMFCLSWNWKAYHCINKELILTALSYLAVERALVWVDCPTRRAFPSDKAPTLSLEHLRLPPMAPMAEWYVSHLWVADIWVLSKAVIYFGGLNTFVYNTLHYVPDFCYYSMLCVYFHKQFGCILMMAFTCVVEGKSSFVKVMIFSYVTPITSQKNIILIFIHHRKEVRSYASIYCVLLVCKKRLSYLLQLLEKFSNMFWNSLIK
jgi:hypothetical protein